MALWTAVHRMTHDHHEPGTLPHQFNALLETTDFLPDDLRVGVLAEMHASLAHYPDEDRVMAAAAIKAKSNFLPPALLEGFLAAARQVEVRNQANPD